MKGRLLPDFLHWAQQQMLSADAGNVVGMNCLAGLLSALAAIFKLGSRLDLLPFAGQLLESIDSLGFVNGVQHQPLPLVNRMVIRFAWEGLLMGAMGCCAGALVHCQQHSNQASPHANSTQTKPRRMPTALKLSLAASTASPSSPPLPPSPLF
jgi:hypothetical protein